MKRWELHAKAWPRNPLSEGITDAANAYPQRFWTRRGAENAIHFYTTQLALPVTYYVVDRRTFGED